MSFKRILHDNFKRTNNFNKVTAKQQFPIFDDDDLELKYLIPNIEYPFDAYRLQVTNNLTNEIKYLCPIEERYRRRMLLFTHPVLSTSFTTNPIKAAIFTAAMNLNGKETAMTQLLKLKDIVRCSPTLFPKVNVDDLSFDAVLCIQDQNNIAEVNERNFILCVTVVGNTFTLISPTVNLDLRWKCRERGYRFSLTSCLHRATWRWHRKNLMDLNGFTPSDPDLGLLKEARKCIKNHPLCSKYSEITGQGRPGVYLIDPYTFKVLRSWDFNLTVENSIGHRRSNYKSALPTVYGLNGERW